MARQVSRLRATVEVAGLALPWGVLKALPLEQAVRVGAALGTVAMAVDRFNRPIALRNLEIAFPEIDRGARMRILRESYRNWGRMAGEWVHFLELDREKIVKYVTYDGVENWKDAISQSDGRGILVLTGHYGNFELLSVAHSLYGNRIAIVHRPNRNVILDEAVTRRRVRFGNAAVPRKGAGREIIRLLRDNWMVAMPLDLDVRKGVFVDFFSMQASTSGSLARLAMATGAPVLPAFMVREDGLPRHRITILPPIEIVKDRDRDASVRENTQRFTTAIETMVRQRPDHWNWVHRRWKTRPPGEQRFY